MPADDLPRACDTARAWASAFRDSEALDNPAHRRHIDGCAECRAWTASVDALARRVAIRGTGSPDVVSAALAAWDRGAAANPRETTVARVVLAAAGIAGLILATVGLADVVTVSGSGSHFARDLFGFEAALSLGFLLAAYRPTRYGTPLLPVAAVAGALTLLSATADVAIASRGLLLEASHLAVLVGVVGLLLLLDGSRGPSPRRASR